MKVGSKISRERSVGNQFLDPQRIIVEPSSFGIGPVFKMIPLKSGSGQFRRLAHYVFASTGHIASHRVARKDIHLIMRQIEHGHYLRLALDFVGIGS